MAQAGKAQRNLDLDTAIAEAEADFLASNPKSVARHEEAKASMPGGNTRSVLHFAPLPLTVERAKGCALWSLDGDEYLDFLCEYTAGLYGHSNPVIQSAVKKALADGVVLGAPNLYEAKLAAILCERFPSLDKVRFCNSGSEADLMTLSLARAATGRDKVLAFREAYHGGFLTLGHGGSTLNVPIPIVLADYNDLKGTKAIIAQEAEDLAAVILEPMMGAGGGIPADPDFLAMLREETGRHGIILVFDEVITSRLSIGGLQATTGVVPDLTALGKYLGGGLSFGAFGGREDLMARFEPDGPDSLFHSGTFNNDVMTMAGGYAGLSEVLSAEALDRLNARGDKLREDLNAVIAEQGLAMTVTGLGSIMVIHFQPGPITRPSQLKDEDPRLKRLFHLAMLEHRIYMSPRGMAALSLPVSDRETAAFVEAFESFVEDYGSLLPKH